jgi:hypothetical protein
MEEHCDDEKCDECEKEQTRISAMPGDLRAWGKTSWANAA